MNHEALPIPELVAVVVGLLLFAVTTKGFADRFCLPFTVSLVLVGIALCEIGPAVFHSLANIRVEPEVILFVFLPTLVFELAYNMDSNLLRRYLAPVLILAVNHYERYHKFQHLR